MQHRPFFFIGNIIESEIDNPIELLTGFNIKKASSSQIKVIKTRLERFREIAHDLMFSINSYECEFRNSGKDKSYWIDHLKEESDWNYWVLDLDYSFDDCREKSNSIISKVRLLDRSFLLSELEIQLLWGFTHYHINDNEIYVDGISSYDYRPLNYFRNQGIFNPDKTVISEQSLKELKLIITQINELQQGSKYDFLKKVLNDFVNYYEIPPNSSFKIISLFAILEHLLTSEDSSKSINKQLQTKLNLINNRLENKIYVDLYFNISKEFKFEKVIEKLYAYRSDIAHGNIIDFENRLQVLNNRGLVENFLLKLTKSIIRQSIEEPELIIDLKKC